MIAFIDFWNFLQVNLKTGTKIRNWTALRSYLGDTMTIDLVTPSAISVQAPRAKNIQVVSMEDFELIWEIWADYKSQKVQRQELRDKTRFSKYIISIIHWYEKVHL